MPRPLALVPAACAAMIIFAVPPSWAQDEPPAHIAVVDGSATIEREATADIAAPNTPLIPGDRVRTDAGRVEILFADGAVLHLDERTVIDLQDTAFVRMLSGRVAIVTLRDRGDLQVDTPAGSVKVGPGVDLRVSLVEADGRDAMEVAVLRGQAQVWTERGSTLVDAGYRVMAAIDEIPSVAAPFNSAHWTDFDRWSQDRLAARRASVGYQYVPPELRRYGGVLDDYGTWGYEPVYGGYVWYPRVASGWRPYYDGRWKFYASFGWTWIGGAVWNWPTHHFGRWGLNRIGRWFWIPGPRWGPAWVHWAVAPGFVSWCPLGFDNRPIVPFWNRHHHFRHGRVWNAWTVLPRRSFERAQFVRRFAVDGSRIVGRAGGPVFVTQASAPAPIAVSRGRGTTRGITAHGRSAVGVAVPRNGFVTSRGRTTTIRSAERNTESNTPTRSGRVSAAAARRTGAVRTAPPASSGRTTLRRGIDRRAGADASRAGVRHSNPRGVDRRTVTPRATPGSQRVPDRRAVPRTAVPRGTVSPGTISRGTGSRSTVSRSTPSRSTPSRSTPSRSTVSRSTVSRSTPSRGTASRSTVSRGTTRSGRTAIVSRPSGARVVPNAPAPSRRTRSVWSPDQVPVHRGPSIPSRISASPSQGGRSATPPTAVPRGYSAPERGRSPRAAPMRSAPAHMSAPSRSGPSRSAPSRGSVRQAPGGSAGRGHAVSRGGGSASSGRSAPSSSSGSGRASGHSRRR